MSVAMQEDKVQFSSYFRPSEVICQTQETDRDKVLMDMLRLLAEQRINSPPAGQPNRNSIIH